MAAFDRRPVAPRGPAGFTPPQIPLQGTDPFATGISPETQAMYDANNRTQEALNQPPQSTVLPNPGGGYASDPASMASLRTMTEKPVQGWTGGAAAGDGTTVSANAFETQQQTQLEADLARQDLERRAALNKAEFDRRFAAISGTGGIPGGPATTTPAFDEEGARAVAFGRAKDQAGQTAMASIQALKDVMAGRGLQGSTIERDQIGGAIGGAAGGVNEFTREQLMQDLNRAASIADREAGANLTRRGQDMSYNQSLMALMNQMGGLY